MLQYRFHTDGGPILIGVLILLVAYLTVGDATPPYSDAYEHDVPLILDGAYRIYQGQIPHTDFHSGLGPVTFLVISTGFVITQELSVSAIEVGSFFFACLVAAVAWPIFSSRFSGLQSVLFVSFLFMYFQAPRAVGVGWSYQLTYAMLYNRHAETFLILGITLLILPSNRVLIVSLRRSMFVAGVFAGLTLFTKVNYFLVMLIGPFVYSSFALLTLDRNFRECLRDVLAFALGLIGLSTLFVLVTGISLNHYVYDLELAYAAQDVRFRFGNLLERADLAAPYLMCLLATSAVLFRFLKLRDAIALNLMVLLLWFAGASIAGGSYQEREFPIIAFGCCLVLRLAASRCVAPREDLNIGAFVFPFFLLIATFLKDLVALERGSGALKAYRPASKCPYVIRSASMESWKLCDRSFVRYINTGISAIRREGIDTSKLIVLDFFNPFPFTLQSKAAPNSALWWHANINFSSESHLPAEMLFKGIEYVMIPKQPRQPETVNLLKRIYSQELSKLFTLQYRNSNWIVYRRRRARSDVEREDSGA